MPPRLSRKMSVAEFENGYWYTAELKELARSIGVVDAMKLRKDQLEKSILEFLRTGVVGRTAPRRARAKNGESDLARGLSLRMRIENYKSRSETKNFIVEQARRKDPQLRVKSGVWYRLNRWREEQLNRGAALTYGDLVQHFLELNATEKFERVPHGRYINFVSDFLAKEPQATREKAVAAWHELKQLDVPKTYAAYAAHAAHAKRRPAKSRRRKV